MAANKCNTGIFLCEKKNATGVRTRKGGVRGNWNCSGWTEGG